MTEFQAYKMYLALRTHFTTDAYDIVKNKGHIKASKQSFLGSGKELAFRRLVKLYNDEEACNFMVANFITGNRWGGIFDGDATKNYMAWKKRKESMRYVFEQDLLTLNEYKQKDLTIFGFTMGYHPTIIKCYLGSQISLETLVILDKITGFTEWMLLNDSVWDDVKRLIVKYKPFVKVDKELYKNIALSHDIH